MIRRKSHDLGMAGVHTGPMSVAELGAEISRRVGRTIPHDGYLLVGLDPVTGAGCFVASEHAYSAEARRRLEIEEAQAGPSPWRSPRPVLALGPGAAVRNGRRVREIMAAEGIGAALRIAVRWGELVLLRESGFSAAEADQAERLTVPLADTVRRFVTSRPLTPVRHRPPGVLVVDPGTASHRGSARWSNRRWKACRASRSPAGCTSRRTP
jgi:hypothetical protein